MAIQRWLSKREATKWVLLGGIPVEYDRDKDLVKVSHPTFRPPKKPKRKKNRDRFLDEFSDLRNGRKRMKL